MNTISLIAVLTAILISPMPQPEPLPSIAPSTTTTICIDQIVDDKWVRTETIYNDTAKHFDIPVEDFNSPVKETDTFNGTLIHGKIDGTLSTVDGEILYHFKSTDNSVWWMLTESEIGFVPNLETDYVLIYYNNETTAENKPCDCLPEYECECEVYDDIFLGIWEA